MAKAKITLPDGATIEIDGTPEEVAAVVQRVSPSEGGATGAATRSRGKPVNRKADAQTPNTRPMGPIDYIRELAGENFFAAKRSLGEIKAKLDEQAHFYPVTSLSPALVRLVRRRELRRIKENGAWRYVNP